MNSLWRPNRQLFHSFEVLVVRCKVTNIVSETRCGMQGVKREQLILVDETAAQCEYRITDFKHGHVRTSVYPIQRLLKLP